MKDICFKINIDIFDYDIWFYKWLVDIFKKKFWKYDHEEDPNHNLNTCDYKWSAGITFIMEADRRAFVYIFNDDEDTLIHETNHAIQWMLDILWIPMWIENEELMSILQWYIQTKVLRKFWKLKKPS